MTGAIRIEMLAIAHRRLLVTELLTQRNDPLGNGDGLLESPHLGERGREHFK